MQGGLGTSGQGNNGGTQSFGYAIGGGGGGGAGTGGSAGTQAAPFGGAGGHGILLTISGNPVYYGGGGGGCAGNSGSAYSGTVPGGLGGGGTGLGPTSSPTTIADGAANTGGGGGGTCDSNIGGTVRAGNGGSGIVVVRYALTSALENPLAQTRFNSQTKSLETYKGNNKWEPYVSGEKIVTNGMRFYMDPLEHSGSGTTIFDLSGFGNNATINGTVTHNATVGFFDLGTNQKFDVILQDSIYQIKQSALKEFALVYVDGYFSHSELSEYYKTGKNDTLYIVANFAVSIE
jgi:hypothetical protein